MPVELTTVGHLRRHLAKLMVAVQAGEVTTSQAMAIARVAEQINANIFAEVKAAQMSQPRRSPTPAGEPDWVRYPYGDMPVGKDADTEEPVR